MMNEELHCARCKKLIERGYYGTGAAVLNGKEYCYDCARVVIRKMMREQGEMKNLRLECPHGFRLFVAYINLQITVNAKYMHMLKDGRTRFWFKFCGEVWTGITGAKHPFCDVRRTTRKSLPHVGKSRGTT